MPQPANPCHVDTWGEHPATRRTGYCDHHHAEYLAEKNRWRSALGNYRKGNTSKDPGPWERRRPHIPFTAQGDISVRLSASDRSFLRDLADRLHQVSLQNTKQDPDPHKGLLPISPGSTARDSLPALASRALRSLAEGHTPKDAPFA